MKSLKQAPLRTKSSVKNSQLDEEFEEDEVAPEESLINVLNSLCEVEKKKSSGGEFQKKKVELYNAAREQGRVVVRDTLAYLNEIKTTMADMKSRETSVEKSLQDLPSLLAHRDECGRSLLRGLPQMVDELSPRRAEEINDASATLESFVQKRKESHQRVLKCAKDYIDEGLEQQKLALDATELIKHYKALLRS